MKIKKIYIFGGGGSGQGGWGRVGGGQGGWEWRSEASVGGVGLGGFRVDVSREV